MTNVNKITIRRSDDHKLVGALDQLCFPDDDPYPTKQHGCVWWVAWVGEQPVAFAGLRVFKSLDYGFLCRAGVLPNWRGQGLQRRLLAAREVAARRLDLDRIITYTAPDNLASANSLIGKGYRLYQPDYEYGCDGALYFYKDLD